MTVNRTNKQSRGSSRLPLLAPILLLCGFGWVAANQLRVQVVGRGAVLDAARSVKRLYSTQPLIAHRGDIRSSDGKILARSTNRKQFGMTFSKVSNNPTMWARVSDVTGVSAAELSDLASRQKGSGTWDVELSSSQAAAFQDLRSTYGADGLWLKPAFSRDYPLGEYAAPIVGFLKDRVGSAGIEKSQDQLLKGSDGKLVGVMDRAGSFLPWAENENSKAASDGADIELTIQSDLQIAVMKALKAQCQKHKATQGAAIVLDPKTGDILAMATWPTYSPERRDEALATASGATPQANPAIFRRFEPGSTFKVFTVAYGLENHIINPNESVYCSGSKTFGGRTMSCSHDHGPKSHGVVTPQRCIEVSCNVAAATWGTRIGFARYSKLIESLGLLQKQNIGLQPEIRGLLRYDDPSKVTQAANLGFGQAVNVTPIGLASAFTVFANDGVRVHPRLIKSIRGITQPTESPETVFKPETAHTMLKMMERVIQSDDGTGKKLRIPGFVLAGKTGTAQKLDAKSTGRRYVSSFVGFVPAERPRAVVLVMVDDPRQNGYYGAVVAGPVFKETAQALLKSFRIAPAGPGAAFAVR